MTFIVYEGGNSPEALSEAAEKLNQLINAATLEVLHAGIQGLLKEDLESAKLAISRKGVDPNSELGKAFLLLIQFEVDAIEEDSEDPEDDPPRSA